MKKLFAAIAITMAISGCATSDNNRLKDIPIQNISVGMSKNDVVSNLGKPHRIMSSEIVNGVNRQIWMYQQDKIVWLYGNAFLGGRTRNDQVTYLLGFEDDRLIGWKDNELEQKTKGENTFEIRNR